MSEPTDTNQASEDEQSRAIRTAISKDFEAIYVKEFTTNWKIERLSRNLEIGVMDFDAIQALIRTEKLKQLDEVIHQSTVNLKSAKAVAGWAELRKKQLGAEL